MEPPPPLASVTLPIVRVGIFPEQIVSPVFEIFPAVNGGRIVMLMVFEVAVVVIKQAPPVTVISQVTASPLAKVVLV